MDYQPAWLAPLISVKGLSPIIYMLFNYIYPAKVDKWSSVYLKINYEGFPDKIISRS